MCALSNKLPATSQMASFFRRNKPDARSERRYSIEELAAAFPPARVDDPLQEVPVVAPAVTDQPTATDRPAAPDETSRAEPVDAAQPETARSPDGPDAARPVDAKAATRPVAAAVVRVPSMPAEASLSAAGLNLLEPGQQPAGLAPAVPMARSAGSVQTTPTLPQQLLGDSLLERMREAEPDQPAFPPPAGSTLPAPAGKPGWRERLRGTVLARSFGSLFSRNPKLDEDLLDEIETALLTADVGVPATTALVDDLRKRMKARQFADARALLTALRAELIALLQPVARPLQIDPTAKPFVLLVVGVNGVGKTTTIGKLARRFCDEKRSLMLAAGDTFRAAAVAQLQAWGDRNDVPVIAQGHNTLGKGGDAASVAFDALQAARSRGTEVLIADTAGRLHTQHGLMAELGKIKRVLAKVDPGAPHEVLMVIDGTTGQNAISQLRQFHAAVGVTGLVVTKLDGSAKGGVVFALAREFNIPIRYAGIGEGSEDLRVFDAEAFVDALLPQTLGT